MHAALGALAAGFDVRNGEAVHAPTAVADSQWEERIGRPLRIPTSGRRGDRSARCWSTGTTYGDEVLFANDAGLEILSRPGQDRWLRIEGAAGQTDWTEHAEACVRTDCCD